MKQSLLILSCVLLASGCAAAQPENNYNSNSAPPGTCTQDAECNGDQVCCQTAGAPVVNGQVLRVCSSVDNCCNCFSTGACDRCDPNSEECFVVSQGVGECRAMPCLYPTCTTSEDCSSGELCCSSLTDCEGCLGACVAPTSAECSTSGTECGGGPYAAAEPSNGAGGIWNRRHRIIPLPASHPGAATVSAVFRWQHDAGRPPPHDFAIGMGADRSPVFQVFGRNGRSFARFGLQLVPLEKGQLYRISLTLEPHGKTTRARAHLVRVKDHSAVLTASTQVPSQVRSIWREQLSPSNRAGGARIDLRQFWIQSAGRIGSSVAQRLSPERQDACGTSI